jgi:hypothetical protein
MLMVRVLIETMISIRPFAPVCQSPSVGLFAIKHRDQGRTDIGDSRPTHPVLRLIRNEFPSPPPLQQIPVPRARRLPRIPLNLDSMSPKGTLVKENGMFRPMMMMAYKLFLRSCCSKWIAERSGIPSTDQGLPSEVHLPGRENRPNREKGRDVTYERIPYQGLNEYSLV